MLDIRQQGNLYTITFSHPDRDQFNLLVESMKEIGAEWDRQTKSWILVEKKRADILLKCKAFSGTPSALLESIRKEKAALLGLPPLNGPKAPEGISLMPHQEEGVGFIEQREGSLIAWEVGVGKGQPKSGIVITPDGPRKMGDIRVGDSVLGSDGKPTTVTGVFERGVLPVYRVSFSDGSSLVVDGDHLWNVKSNNCRSKGRKWRTLETRFLASRPMRGPCNEWSIPQCGPAQFTQSSSPLPIDPWLLGALLGDGSFRGGIHFSTADVEMLGRVSGSLPDDTAKLTRDGKYDYRLSRSPLLLSAIRSMGLYGKYSHEKFVPAEYLLAAPYDRLELLRGLMDTDGHALPTGGTEYSTTSAMLKDAVVFIAQSLGGVARVRKRESYLNGVRHLDSYRVNVKLPEGVNPFWLPRKSHACVEPTKYPPRRYIRSIVPCGEEDVVCISVANPDGLYLAESFIVTHNTGVSIASINAAGQQGFPALIICPAHLKHNWYKELKGDPELNKKGWLIDKSRTVGIASGSYFPPTDVVIINYDILDRHKDKLDSIPWAFAIIDESHFCKNPKAKRTKAIIGGSKGRGKDKHQWKPLHAKRRIALSGTPLVNKPEDLWAVCNWLDPKRWPSKYWFESQFCTTQKRKQWVKRGGRAQEISIREVLPPSRDQMDKLNKRLTGTIMSRIRSKDVLNLPPLIRRVIEVDVAGDSIRAERKTLEGNRERVATLRAALEVAKATGDDTAYAQAIRELTDFQRQEQEHVAVLRKKIAMEKVPYVVDHVRNILLDPDRKALVFAHHHCVIEALYEAFSEIYPNGVVHFYGNSTPDEKKDAERRIQNDPSCRIFIGGITAAGTGLTLTGAQHVVFAEEDWVPSNMRQCEGRAWRKGQTVSVLVEHIVAYGSVDSLIAKRMIAKQEISDQAIDAGLTLDEPIDWIEDHRLPALPELEKETTPYQRTAYGYGLSKLVANPRHYNVTDLHLIIASRLAGKELKGKAAAYARWLCRTYLGASDDEPVKLPDRSF